MARRCYADLVLALALSSTALAFLPAQNPPWPPSYAMNRSTISMACNRSGWFDADLVRAYVSRRLRRADSLNLLFRPHR